MQEEIERHQRTIEQRDAELASLTASLNKVVHENTEYKNKIEELRLHYRTKKDTMPAQDSCKLKDLDVIKTVNAISTAVHSSSSVDASEMRTTVAPAAVVTTPNTRSEATPRKTKASVKRVSGENSFRFTRQNGFSAPAPKPDDDVVEIDVKQGEMSPKESKQSPKSTVDSLPSSSKAQTSKSSMFLT